MRALLTRGDDHLRQMAAEDLFALPAKSTLGRGVPLQDAARGVDGDEGIERSGEDGALEGSARA